MSMLRRAGLSLMLLMLLVLGAFAPGAPVRAQDSQYVLRILHTNDHHAHLEPVTVGDQKLGGISQRKTLVDRYRADSQSRGEPLLLLDAGDIFQGTLYFNQYNGQADLYFYNALQYDAVAVGNHEFDRGQQVLADFINGAAFPMVSANVQVAPTSPLAGKIKPWVILEENGNKIGIFGLTTEETAQISTPGAGVTFTNYIESARRAVSELQAQGVNKIIALTHIGMLYDIELARQVNGIDVVVGGHSHSPVGNMPNAQGPYPLVERAPDGQQVLIVTDWEWGKYLGDIRVVFDTAGKVTYWEGAPHAVDASIPADPVFEAKLNEYRGPIAELQKKVIGQAAVLLNGERADVRTKETNLGNLIADAMLGKVTQAGGQVAIMNGGGIRASIPAGDVSVGKVTEVLPFGNTLALVDVTGAQLKEALENGVSQVEQAGGRFPQVGGMKFVFNPAAPAGSRVVAILVRGSDGSYRAADPAATYRVVTNNFMLNGGDGYTAFREGRNKIDTGFVLDEVVMEYITARSPVNPQVEGRITQGTTGPDLPNTGVEATPVVTRTVEPPAVVAPTAGTGASPTAQPNDLPVALPDTGVEATPVVTPEAQPGEIPVPAPEQVPAELPATSEPATIPAVLLLAIPLLLALGLLFRRAWR